MTLDRRALSWGCFFIVVGLIPLAVRAGYLTSAQVAETWRLWPLLIVAAGLRLILRRTRLEGLSRVVTAIFFGVLVGGLIGGNGDGLSGFSGIACGPGGSARPFEARTGTLTSPAASVDLTLDCGDATVSTQGGSTWQVAGSAADGRGPDVVGDASRLSVSSPHDRGPFSWWGSRAAWQVTLPTDPDLELTLDVNAGRSTFDLAGARLRSVDVQMNAGTATVDLGEARAVGDLEIEVNAGSLGLTLPAAGTTGTIQINAGSVRLCVPAGVGLRLRTGDSVISSFGYDGHGLIHDGSTWQTEGFATASVKIDLSTQANAGSFSLDPKEGCHG